MKRESMGTVLRIFKILWASFWAGLATMLVFTPIVVTSSLSSTGNLAVTISKAWAWVMLKVTGVRPEIRGRGKILPSQSYVIISNHQSHFDLLALVIRLGVQFRWIIKKELRSVDTQGYTHDTIGELIAVTRNTIIANFNPNYPEGRTP